LDKKSVPAGGVHFSLVPIDDASTTTGAQLETSSVAAGLSGMNRPEDGSWDPSDSHNFYFNTTAAFNGITRSWKLRFDDPGNVLTGWAAALSRLSRLSRLPWLPWLPWRRSPRLRRRLAV
jgi:hypothetical protein